MVNIAQQNRSGGMDSNQEHFGAGVSAGPDSSSVELLLYDPQTSGGLLVAVSPEAADQAADAFRQAGVLDRRIGMAVAAIPGINILVRP